MDRVFTFSLLIYLWQTLGAINISVYLIRLLNSYMVSGTLKNSMEMFVRGVFSVDMVIEKFSIENVMCEDLHLGFSIFDQLLSSKTGCLDQIKNWVFFLFYY